MTIKDVSIKTGLTEYTLRYYEKAGILPPVKRNEYGQRVYGENDLNWMDFLLCLKGTGLSLRGIRQIMELYSRGDETIPERIRLLKEHKKQTLLKLSELKVMLEKIDGKISWYEGMVSGKKEASPVQKPSNRVQSA